MRPVRVTKKSLLATVKKNRKAHHAIFLEALEGFRQTALAQFEAEVEKIRKGKGFRAYVNISAPSDHTKDYDAAIGMLELSLDDTVELDEKSYRELVQNQWEWTQQFLASNSYYSATAARLAKQNADD